MIQIPCLVALQELKTLPGPERQIQCLRRIKNDIVGHTQRKELVVKAGLLEPLQHILASTAKASGKRISSHVNGSRHTSPTLVSSSTLEDEARLQAILIVGILANAGIAFCPPLYATNIFPLLLQTLSPGNAPSKIRTAALRTTYGLVTASSGFESAGNPELCHLTFTYIRPYIKPLLAVLQQNPASEPQQVRLAAKLFSACCHDCSSRDALVKAGVLDVLASHLADYAVDSAHPTNSPQTTSALQSHAFAAILMATSAIVEYSAYRAHSLIFSPALKKVFFEATDHLHDPTPSAPSFSSSGPGARHAMNTVPIDQLLPRVITPKVVSFAPQSFPALSTYLTSSRLLPEHSIGDIATSAPLCIWLIHVARTEQSPSCRLDALRLLAIINIALDQDKSVPPAEVAARARERERQIALLAVPLAVSLVRDASVLVLPDDATERDEALNVQKKACRVLATLVSHSQELQKAAVDAGAIKHVSLILRKSFNPVDLAKPMWSPYTPALDSADSHFTTLGDSGLAPEISRAMQSRAGALRALAAISHKEDSHRKAIIDQGVITCLIDSLKPYPEQLASGVSDPKEGNSISVLIAACKAANALSRSVSLLRTSLIDAGIAKPVLALLKHRDNAVQVAATNVIINLVLDFSPMRPHLIEAGAVKTLCEHARRSNVELRLASMWALKHVVLNAPKDFKIATLDELGTGWLIQAVSGVSDTQSSAPLGMGTPNAAGEQVDLLNAPDMDQDMDAPEEGLGEGDEDGELFYDNTGTPYQSSGLRTTLHLPDVRSRLRILRDYEQNIILQARQKDVEIQEQALDFIRNLMNGEDAAAMVDHLFVNLGAQRIFDLLHSKLRSTAVQAGSGGGALKSRTVWQPPEIIHSAVHLINHITAASPRHKQLLIAQKQLLTTWLPHFAHADSRVRVISCWAVINLTWVEDQSDREDARRRAQELRAVGIEAAVRALANDSELDTRERVKTAIRQLDELLDGQGRHR